MPVFGICRGVQVLNVHAGGTLHQHVADHARQDQPRDQEIHRVHFEEGSLSSRLYGSEIGVNSLHHPAVDQLGDGLRAVGWSDAGPDGEPHIEELGSADGRILGVQWHQEMMEKPDPVFARIVGESSRVNNPDVVFVTGGASDIGRAVANRLASEGAAILMADIDAENGIVTETMIAEARGRAMARAVDVRDRASIRSAADDAVAEFGRIDALVICPPPLFVHHLIFNSYTTHVSDVAGPESSSILKSPRID